MKVAGDFWTAKTTRLTCVVILGALAAYLSGEATWQQLVVATIASLQSAFFRDTIVRGHEAAETDAAASRLAHERDVGMMADAVEGLREDLRTALQVTAESGSRLLTLAEVVADQATALSGANLRLK